MTNDDALLLREIATNTKLIAQLLSVSLPKGFTSRVGRTLDSEQKRIAYQHTDGVRSAREVSRLAGTTHPTVGRWGEDWVAMGLAEDVATGRSRAAFDLKLLTLADRLDEAMQ